MADLLSLWVAGHLPAIRDDMLRDHIELVEMLVAASDPERKLGRVDKATISQNDGAPHEHVVAGEIAISPIRALAHLHLDELRPVGQSRGQPRGNQQLVTAIFADRNGTRL